MKKKADKPKLPPIPQLKNVTKQVDFLLVTYSKHPAFEALDLLPQVGVLLGKLIENVPGLSIAALTDVNFDMAKFGPALVGVFTEIREMERNAFVLSVLSCTQIEASTLQASYMDSMSKVEAYFGDNLQTLLKVILGAMRQTFGNFIDADFVKNLVKSATKAAAEKTNP